MSQWQMRRHSAEEAMNATHAKTMYTKYWCNECLQKSIRDTQLDRRNHLTLPFWCEFDTRKYWIFHFRFHWSFSLSFLGWSIHSWTRTWFCTFSCSLQTSLQQINVVGGNVLLINVKCYCWTHLTLLASIDSKIKFISAYASRKNHHKK